MRSPSERQPSDGRGRMSGGFGRTRGSSIKISDKKMHQEGKHFNKHGRGMDYGSKKAYDAAAKEFARKYQDHPDARVYEGKWNGSGKLGGNRQRAITFDGKTVIIDKNTGQIVDYYIGEEYRGLIDLERIR